MLGIGSSIFTSNSYLNDLRVEVFSQEPLKSFILFTLNDEERNIILTNDEFLLVADHYDWLKIYSIFNQILFACDEEFSVSDPFACVWKCLPEYLEYFEDFFIDIITSKYPYLKFLHNIMTQQYANITIEQIQLSNKLINSYYLSLDIGIIIKKQEFLSREYKFHHIISISKAKIRRAITAIHDYVWPNVDIEDIIDIIINNKGTEYYNISSNTWVNYPIITQKTNVNDKYKFVANKSNFELFHHCVELLENQILIEPVELTVEAITTNYLNDRIGCSDK